MRTKWWRDFWKSTAINACWNSSRIPWVGNEEQPRDFEYLAYVANYHLNATYDVILRISSNDSNFFGNAVKLNLQSRNGGLMPAVEVSLNPSSYETKVLGTAYRSDATEFVNSGSKITVTVVLTSILYPNRFSRRC